MSHPPTAPGSELDTWDVTRHGQPETLRLHEHGLVLAGPAGDWDLSWSQVADLTFPAAFSTSIHAAGQDAVVVGFRSAADQRAFRTRASELLEAAAATGVEVPTVQLPVAAAATPHLPLLTLQHVPGRQVIEHLGTVIASSVWSRNLFSDAGSDLKSVFGGTLGGMEKAIEQACETAKESLSRKASALGADAVIGVQLQLESVSDKAQAVMLLGTAVRTSATPTGATPPQ